MSPKRPSRASKAASAPLPASKPRYRILIVEDVDSMRELIQMALEGIPGFQVSGVAANTWEARLELSRRRPDLVLLDEVLPGESSLDLVSEFREANVPVVFITSLQDRNQPLPEGVVGRLVKPGWQSLSTDQKRIEQEICTAMQHLKAPG